jgi:hypothetical protein
MAEVSNIEEPTSEERMKALAEFLEIQLEDGEELEDYVTEDSYTDNAFEAEGNTYLVLTDSEADDAAEEYVKESLWAFNSSFLSDQTGLPEEVFSALQERCEDANETFLTLVEKHCEGGISEFTKEAIRYDGRGHFLSQWNGAEDEAGEFYIYRTN